jgi:hypothetical protein
MRQPIGNKTRLDNHASGLPDQAPPKRRTLRPIFPASLLLLILGLSIPSWSLPSTSAQSADFPDAPEAQAGSQLATQSSTQPSGVQTGSIHGVVADRDGAVYQGVQITLTQTVPGPAPANTTSDSNGQFQFLSVPPGPFKLTVSSQGFNTQIISGVLHSGESYQAPVISLAFATATSEVQVTASRVEIAQEQLHEEDATQHAAKISPRMEILHRPRHICNNRRNRRNRASR